MLLPQTSPARTCLRPSFSSGIATASIHESPSRITLFCPLSPEYRGEAEEPDSLIGRLDQDRHELSQARSSVMADVLGAELVGMDAAPLSRSEFCDEDERVGGGSGARRSWRGQPGRRQEPSGRWSSGDS